MLHRLTAVRQYVTNPHNKNQFIPNVPLRPMATKHSLTSPPWGGTPRKIGCVCGPLPKALTLLMTKVGDFSYRSQIWFAIYDLKLCWQKPCREIQHYDDHMR